MNNILGGVGSSITTPLISFDVIIDQDVSLITYVVKNIHNKDVFDYGKLKQFSKYKDVVKELYLRKYMNPLYLIMRDDENKEFLDECYEEFKQTQEYFDHYIVASDFYDVVIRFLDSDGTIIPTILCKTEKEKSIIEKDNNLKGISILMMDDFNENCFAKYGQYYLRYSYEIDRYMEYKPIGKSFYISSCGLNRTEDNSDIEFTENIETLLSKRLNHVNIFDMYIQEISERNK